MDNDNNNVLLTKLENDIKNWEGQEIEFIEDFPVNASDIAKEIAAFATSNDAIIYLGVDKNKKKVGLSEVKSTDDTEGKDKILDRLAGITQKSVKPSIIVISHFIDIKDKKVVLRIDISKGIEPVYYSNDIPWIRNLTASERAGPDQVKELHRRYFLEQGLLKEVERPFLDFRIMMRNRHNERLYLFCKNITNTTAVDICIEFIGEYFKQIFWNKSQHIRIESLQKDESWRPITFIKDYNLYDRSKSKIIAHYKDINGKEYSKETSLNHIVYSLYEYWQ